MHVRISRRRRGAGAIAAVVTLVAAAGIVAVAPPAGADHLNGPVQLLNRWDYQCLDVLGFDSSNGATIGQWWCDGASNQVWYIDWHNLSGEPFQIKSGFSGKCMDVAGANYVAGARVVQYTCHGGLNQKFDFEMIGLTGTGNGIFRFHLRANWDLCLDVLGANDDYGAPLGVWTCNGAYNQQFIVET